MSFSFGTQFILSPKRPLVASLLWVCKPLFFLSHLRRFFYILPHIRSLHPCMYYSIPTGLYLTGDSLCLFLNKIQYLAKIVIFLIFAITLNVNFHKLYINLILFLPKLQRYLISPTDYTDISDFSSLFLDALLLRKVRYRLTQIFFASLGQHFFAALKDSCNAQHNEQAPSTFAYSKNSTYNRQRSFISPISHPTICHIYTSTKHLSCQIDIDIKLA